jgi:hypothetical protein
MGLFFQPRSCWHLSMVQLHVLPCNNLRTPDWIFMKFGMALVPLKANRNFPQSAIPMWQMLQVVRWEVDRMRESMTSYPVSIWLENGGTDFREIWYGRYAIGGFFNFLQSITPTWRIQKSWLYTTRCRHRETDHFFTRCRHQSGRAVVSFQCLVSPQNCDIGSGLICNRPLF